jgi:hypothetical protein
VDREYPNKPGNVVDGDETVRPPRELTPAFSGCFDWHSAVHGHWALVRVLKTFPDVRQAREIRAALDRHLRPERIRREVEYFELQRNRTFERPYGWAWLLRLQAELLTWDDPDAKRWSAALRPLADLLSARMTDYLGRLSLPVRSGVHQDTAFALGHALDYARVARDTRLEEAVKAAASRFYLGDRNCPLAYEPSGEDFSPPCLAEADVMRRVLDPDTYSRWLDGFLPAADSDAFARWATPPEIRDLKDPKLGHLIGLNWSRAAFLSGVASVLPGDDPRRGAYAAAADAHCAVASEQMFESGYGGEHWLATFALFHLTAAGR